MFPPFDQEEARKICLFIAKELDKGEAKLSIPEKESLERRGNGLMLGVLTGFLEEDKSVDQNLAPIDESLSRQAGKETPAHGILSTAEKSPDNESSISAEKSSPGLSSSGPSSPNSTSTPSNQKKCIIVTVSGISRGLEFTESFFESIKKEDFFQDSFFYYAPPLVAQNLINKALAENDGEIHRLTDKINDLKEKRRLPSGKFSDISEEEKELVQKRLSLTSESLKKVYSLYNFKSMQGKSFSLMQIMERPLQKVQIKLPPTGTGDCAAPKRLEKAIELKLKISSMAEIYYGKENKNRLPLQLYPPCDERCALILPTILGLEILYRDSDIVVINKESGLLSVPGRGPDKEDSVTSRLKKIYPDCIQQPAVHRLDMETSGLMVLALTKEAHRELNRQFENRETQKEYEALLDGRAPEERLQNIQNKKQAETGKMDFSEKAGSINTENFPIPQSGCLELYFRVDLENRPHQIWDQVYGKKAITEFHLLGKETYTNPRGEKIPALRLHFIPHTGRTHQLRLASADIHGLNHPIIGDTLYGHCLEGERLLLHAKKLSFTHPVTGQRMTFESKVPF